VGWPKRPVTLADWAEYGVGEVIGYGEGGVPIYEDYRVPNELRPKNLAREPEQAGVGWGDILERWSLVVPDLAAVYGVDLYDPRYEGRSWLWLRGLILGLLGRDSLLARALAAEG